MRMSGMMLIMGLCIAGLAGCAAHPVRGPGEYRISGELRGVNGGAPRGARLLLSKLGDDLSKPLAKADLSPEGDFSLKAPGPGEYRLWLTAPGYPVRDLYVQVREGAPDLTLQATLEPYDYLMTPEAPAVIGSWNDMDEAKAEALQPLADGTWVLERAVPGDSVTYQFKGITTSDHAVSCYPAESYEMDESGKHMCRAVPRGGKVRILLDPRQWPRSTQPAFVQSRLASPYEDLNPLNALHTRATSLSARAFAQKMRSAGKTPPFDYGSLPADLVGLMRDPHQSLLTRQLAALEVLGLHHDLSQQYPGAQGEALAEEVRALLPTDSPRWALNSAAVGGLVDLVAEPKQKALLMDFADHQSDADVQAQVLYFLLERARKEKDPQQVAALIERLQPYAKQSMFAQFVIQRYKSLAHHDTLKGQPIPDFSLPLLDGAGTVSRESLKGRFYLIDFWATWCVPCMAQLPLLHAAAEKFKGRGDFTILSVSLDEGKEQVRQFRAGQWKMPWLNVCENESATASLFKGLQLSGIPFAVLVDAQGTVVALQEELKGEQLDKTLDTLLPARAP